MILWGVVPKLLSKHFCYNENENGAADTSSEENIHQGVTRCGQHGFDYECEHTVIGV